MAQVPNELLAEPGNAAISAAMKAWQWLLPESWKPVFCTAIGDIFIEQNNGEIWWMECGRGVLERVAGDIQQFSALIDSAHIKEWFLPQLVAALRQEGKVLAVGQCYSFTTLPVFAEGKYESRNMYVAPAQEHYELTAHIHRQIRDMPNGAKIELKIAP